jgi:hypothetical protein
MSINGVSASTLNGARAASSDGVDDFGTVPSGTVETLPEQEQFAVAMVFKTDTDTVTNHIFGLNGTDGFFGVADFRFTDGSPHEISFIVQDSSGTSMSVNTVSKFFNDNTTHLCVINKRGNNANTDVEIYVDSMTQTQTLDVVANGFDHTLYSLSGDMGFFAENTPNGIEDEMNIDLPFIEFNEQPYSQQDRLDLQQRAPGF